MKVWAMPVARPYMLNARRAAELIQSDLAKVGVTVEIVTYEWAEYLKLSKAKDRDGAVMLGWTGDNGDPDNFLDTLLGCDAVGGNNRAQWCNKEFDDLVTKAKETSDQAERTKLYEQAQVVFKEQAPWDTLDHSLVFMPMSKKVVGLRAGSARLSSLRRRRHRRIASDCRSGASRYRDAPTGRRCASDGRSPEAPRCCGSSSVASQF